MTKQLPVEVFMPPNPLKAKVGGGAAGLDASALERAEQALASLSIEFDAWIASDVQQLSRLRDVFAARPDEAGRNGLYRASLDLKGHARTFEFPLVERVAASLCHLLGSPAPTLQLVDAHVGAIRVIVRENIRDPSDHMASTLAAELETRVGEFLCPQS